MWDNKRYFRKSVLTTTIAVYLLILVGGIVRTTGAGMGCPDWPKCFGNYVPPASDSSLPKDYQKVYLEKRLAKTERLAKLLKAMGLDQVASVLKNNTYIADEAYFDVTKAWTEYINRLIGVVIGILVILTAITSFSYRKDTRLIPILGIAGLILVLFQGWFGSLVVATNLIPGFVTIHMFLALLQIVLLIYLIYRTSSHSSESNQLPFYLILGLFVLIIPQLYLGTQVRHVVDLAIFEGLEKSQWLRAIDWKFYVHRSLSLLFLTGTGYLFYQVNKLIQNLIIRRVTLSILLLVALESIGGALMYYLYFPPSLQPLHLLAASLIFGLLFYLLLVSGKNLLSKA